MHGGELAHLPWLQAAPDPLTSITWQTWIELNDITAARFGIRQGDVVRVESAQGSIRAVAYLTPATPPEVVGIPFGGGRRHGSQWANGRPATESSNVTEILEPTRVAGPGSLAWAGTRVRIYPPAKALLYPRWKAPAAPSKSASVPPRKSSKPSPRQLLTRVRRKFILSLSKD